MTFGLSKPAAQSLLHPQTDGAALLSRSLADLHDEPLGQLHREDDLRFGDGQRPRGLPGLLQIPVGLPPRQAVASDEPGEHLGGGFPLEQTDGQVHTSDLFGR